MSGSKWTTRLLASYFGPWAFERWADGRIYELLGIRLWKWFLRTSGKPQKRWKRSSSEGGLRARLIARLEQQERFTREYELRHLAGGFLMQASGVAYVAVAEEGNLLVLTAINVLVNGYPILLQRYNRVRVRAALARVTKL